MKTHQILCGHHGEYSYTSRDPVAVWHGQVDLAEKHDCILSSDDWRPWTTNKWEVREVALPDWLSPEEWIRDSVRWKYTWGMGVNPEWPETWQRALGKMNEVERLACAKLLKVKSFRSDFRRSLRDQLEQWMAGVRPYESPFSPRQWDALIPQRLRYEADSLSASLYRSR